MGEIGGSDRATVDDDSAYSAAHEAAVGDDFESRERCRFCISH